MLWLVISPGGLCQDRPVLPSSRARGPTLPASCDRTGAAGALPGGGLIWLQHGPLACGNNSWRGAVASAPATPERVALREPSAATPEALIPAASPCRPWCTSDVIDQEGA